MMDNKSRTEFFRQAVKEKEKKIGELAQCIWEYAEPGYEEYKSAEALIRWMEQEGFHIERGIGGLATACLCSYGEGEPRIGILAEYDALPGMSQKAGKAEKEEIEAQSCGHGCGHNVLCAGAAAAAALLKEYLKITKNEGTVCLYGCPAEEAGAGKVYMTAAGCFEGLDAVFGWHPEFYNAVTAVKSSAYYQVKFRFYGISAHAAEAPERGRSALDACELMNVGANYLREHVSADVRFHYAYLNCGGEAPNVVQSSAEMLYYIRAPKIKKCREVLRRIQKIAQGAAMMTETEVEWELVGGLNDLIPNGELIEVLSRAMEETKGPEFTEEDYAVGREFWKRLEPEEQERIKESYHVGEEFAKKPLLTSVMGYRKGNPEVMMAGSTDVGDVSYHVPTAQLFATCGVPGTALHSWQMTAQAGSTIGTRAAACAAMAIAFAGSIVIENSEILERAKEELKARTKDGYECPLKL